MSKLNVNAIEPSTGTDITLGASGDTITTPSGAVTSLDGAVTVNDSSNDVDFRVESNGDANALFVQGSDGFVGLGQGTPRKMLHITEASSDCIIVLDSNDTVADKQICFTNDYGTGGETGGNYWGVGIDDSENELNIAFDADSQASMAADSLLAIASGGDVTVKSGNLVMGTAGKGIDFSANSGTAGASSQLLDDYEEGTWTVQDTDGGGSAQSGMYTKIGNLVTCYFHFTTGSVSGSDTFYLTNLPFTVGSTDAFRGPVSISYTNATTMPLAGNVVESSTTAYLLIGTGDIATDDEIGSSKVIAASMIYRV